MKHFKYFLLKLQNRTIRKLMLIPFVLIYWIILIIILSNEWFQYYNNDAIKYLLFEVELCLLAYLSVCFILLFISDCFDNVQFNNLK